MHTRPHPHPDVIDAIRRVRRSLDDAEVTLLGRRVLALCSGGADSVALVELLASLPRGAAPRGVEVLWLDHGLRPDAVEEAAAARAVARRHDLQLHERSAGAGAIRPVDGGLEAAARAWRYEVAAAVAAERGCDVVATGHSASDQLEQVLMSLVGITGSSGRPDVMPVVRELADGIQLVRPVLALDRSELERVCNAVELGWVDDPTNADASAHRRNAIRHEVVPQLLSVHPGAGQALVRAGERERAARAAAPALAGALLDAWELAPGRLDSRRLVSLPAAARRAIIAEWLSRGGLGRSLTTRLVTAVDRFALGPGRAGCPDAGVDIAGGTCVRRDGYDLVLAQQPARGGSVQ